MNTSTDVTTKRGTLFPCSFAFIKDVFTTVAGFILIAYCVMVIILATTLGYQKYQGGLNQRVVDGGEPIYTKEQLRAAEKHHGVVGLEIRCREWTFTRDKDGYVCKAFPERMDK